MKAEEEQRYSSTLSVTFNAGIKQAMKAQRSRAIALLFL
jgi:hypothetical protein